MNVSVTLVFDSAAEAAAALARLSPTQRIDYADRPDVGVEPPAPPLALVPTPGTIDPTPGTIDPIAIFGSAAAPAAPTIPALSTAVAAALPTALAVPPAGVPAPTPAASLPVPPAPTVVVPTAPVAPTASAGGVEVDSTGLPWDSRIHAGNKATNKDGSWRAKKGLDDAAAVKQIENDLRAARGAAAPVPAPPAPVAAAVPATVPPAPAPVASAGLEFGQLMGLLSPHLVSDNAGTSAKLATILAPLGVPNVGALHAAPHLIPTVIEQFKAMLPK